MRKKPIPFVEVPCQVPGITGPCKQCTLADNGDGYCQIKLRIDGKERGVLVHRLTFEQHFGPIPPSLRIDHVCQNRRCFNPDHLRLVTPRINTTENTKIIFPTACPRGHVYTPASTVSCGKGRRRCRTCWYVKRNARRRANRQAKKAVA